MALNPMFFGGIQKNSLIDYPGKISCVLFTVGCNFDCPYCHNPELATGVVNDSAVLSQDKTLDFLEERIGFLDGVVISGGEPTLHEDLVCFCEKINQMGYPVKLDTNGSHPRTIEKLIKQGLVDYIAMDIKTDPLTYAPHIRKHHDSDSILNSIQTIMASPVAYEFKTTCIRPLIDGKIIKTISRRIKGATRYALQQFQDTGVLHPEFFERYPGQYKEEDLLEFKDIAAPWVQECIVR
jgi:pyruvate formate lyase activating enzyme